MFEEKANESVNIYPFESYNLRFMFIDFENAAHIYAQLNSPQPFFSIVWFKTN